MCLNKKKHKVKHNLNCKCPFCKAKRGNFKGKNNPNYNPEKHKKHYCIEPDCNNEISYINWKNRSGRCFSCATKIGASKRNIFGKNNPNFGNGDKIRGRKNKNYKHGKYIENYCIDCGKKITPKATKCKKCSHKGKNKGKNNGMFGKPTPYAKWTKYKNTWMRSSYEIRFAYFLDCSGIKWEYEPKRFYMDNCSYLPDFYLPEFNTYIEIKGWWRWSDKKRFNLFKKKYSKENIKVLMKPDLQQLGVL